MATPDETNVPPAGEEIHLPGPTFVPIFMAAFITIALVGVTASVIMLVVGIAGFVLTLFLWIRAARREFVQLPPEHHS
jgi:hypothetical protein